MLSLLQLALLAVLGWGASAETGCPPHEDIYPCDCYSPESPILICAIIAEANYTGVFKNLERYFFHEVRFYGARWSSLPHHLFERTHVGKLLVEDSSLDVLFDLPPKSDSLYEIELRHTHFFHNETMLREDLFEFDVLKNLTNLRTIVVHSSTITKISSDFGSRFPSSVRQITLNSTGIQSIEPGALDGLEDLDKFALQFSYLPNLTREMLPRPFNVRFLYFDDNQISSLPGDLFTEMPNLQIVTLRRNSISVVPESAFAGRDRNLPYLGLAGNPLNCNCLLVWLIKDKPEVIDGTCSTPARLQGRHLKDLIRADFNC